MNRTVLLSWLVLALLLVGASCGGGTGALQLDGVRDVQGISEAGFNLVRYDDTGSASNAMNPTLDLAVQPGGDTTTVVIAIDDAQPTLGVTLDLRYDPALYTPKDVEFSGLIDTDVELAVMRLGGLVALGQVSTDGAGTRSGEFAVVTFRNEPNRNVSAAGDAADRSIDSEYNANGFSADGFTADDSDQDGTVDWHMLGIFTSLSGDGDQNGSSNIADLTPLGAMLGQAVSPTDAVSARADYDGNGLPNISDLTPLGANLGEVTTAIEILAGDSEGSLAIQSTVTWASGDSPVNPSVDTGDPHDVWQHWTGSFDGAAVDANSDGFIFVSARALTSGAGTNGTPFTPAIQVQVSAPSNFTVGSVTFQINGVDVNPNDVVQLEANSTVTLAITGFEGTFGGNPFTSGDVGGSVPQGEYDAALAAVRTDFFNNLQQTLDPTGFAGFQTDKSAVILNLTNGNPVTGTVFPDDDPGNTAEGQLTVAFGATNNTVADFNVTLDVTADPNAPLIDDIRSDGGQDGNGNWIVTNTNPDILGHLTFPGGDPAPVDGTTVDVELVDLTNDLVLPINFNFVVGVPMNAGEFTLLPAITGFNFIVRPPAGTLNPANLYMVRFFSPPAENGGSVNQPGQFLTGGQVDSGFASEVLPSDSLNTDNDLIVIVPADPAIRRAPQLDQGDFSQVYPGGYSDMLKNDGNEFTPSIVGGTTYPYVVIQKVNNPGAIDATAVQAGEIQVETNPHRLVVDVLAFADPDTTAETWSYKVFGAPVILGDLSSRPVITEGSFTVNPPPGIGNAPLVGVNFGVNIFDDPINGEGSRDLANLNVAYYSNKTVRLSTLPGTWGGGSNDADVLFVQFNGGEIDPQSQQLNPFEGYSNFSNKVTLHNDLAGDLTKVLDVRVAGVGAGGLDYIGLAHLLTTDTGPGGLVAGLDYEVRLDDPTNPGLEYTFSPDMLSVVN